MTQSLATFDPAEYAKLPDPGGGWMPRRSKPCGECGAEIFLVVRVIRSLKDVDGKPRDVVSTVCQCPNMYEHRREHPPRGLVVLGRFDTRTGVMTIDSDA